MLLHFCMANSGGHRFREVRWDQVNCKVWPSHKKISFLAEMKVEGTEQTCRRDSIPPILVLSSGSVLQSLLGVFLMEVVVVVVVVGGGVVLEALRGTFHNPFV